MGKVEGRERKVRETVEEREETGGEVEWEDREEGRGRPLTHIPAFAPTESCL